MSIELAVVIPTYNESGNIQNTINKIAASLQGINYEIIVVDDNSPDNTSKKVRELADKDNRIRCITRIDREGLSSACMEGFLSTVAKYLAVIDADGQHDESLLPKMLSKLKSGDADLVIASRYVDGGSTGHLPDDRVKISKFATQLSRLIMKHKVSDPMSGFFMLHREKLEPLFPEISAKGFKILLDFLIHASESLRIVEIPYQMRARHSGKSKLDRLVILEFFWVFFEKYTGYKISRQFVSFLIVGLSGIAVHLLSLWMFFHPMGMDFKIAQMLATITAMTSNFFLNNSFTFRQHRLTGWKILSGLLSFYLACSLGAIINTAFAQYMYTSGITWWFAGFMGAMVGAVWNYSMIKIFTWKS